MGLSQSSQPQSTPPWTVGKLLEWTTGHFQKQRCLPARLEAEVLLAAVLECPRIQLYALWDAEVDAAHRDRFRDFVRRRTEGCPVAYLVGKREFFSLEFDVDRRVLIPRPETEYLVGAALAFGKLEPPTSFVDVGVGSGAIAVTLAKHWPLARGYGLDVDEGALAVAAVNVARHGVGDRLQLLKSDFLSAALDAGPFDLVVANPPYVTTTDWRKLAPEVRDFEPRLALDGGADGLECYRRLIPQAAEVLRPGGALMLEIGAGQEPQLHDLLKQSEHWRVQPSSRDQNRISRVVVAERR